MAVAAAQIMKYWNWPPSGVGTNAYVRGSRAFGASFDHPYNWSQMPSVLTGTSTPEQIEAVARLVADVGFAVDMDWGCSSSNSFTVFAVTEALATHFSYRPTTGMVDRSLVSADAFFAAVQADLDAPTPRPILMALENTFHTLGHAIVIDGYQTGPPNLAHVNLGFGPFPATYQGWYNIFERNLNCGLPSDPDCWVDGYTWDVSSQQLFPGIEPYNPHQTLSVSRSGNGTGLVTSAPDGISCARTCWWPFDVSSAVTLTAAPSPGSHFVGWSGDCDAGGSVVMSADRACVARFDLDDTSALPAAVGNAGLSFTVGGAAGWFSQAAVTHSGGTAAESGAIADNQTSSMEAGVVGPATLSFYWSVSSEGDYDFLSVYLDGTLYVDPVGGQTRAISGEAPWTQVSLTIPAGVHTVRWEYSKDTTTTMGSDAGWVDDIVTAPATYTLSVSPSGTGSGVVASAPAGIACGAACAAPYLSGTVVTLSATAAAGSIFTGWTGACTGMGPCVVTMNTSKSVGANFQSSPVYRRYFAEGAATAFFDCYFAIVNTEAAPAHVTLRFLSDDGVHVVSYLDVPALARRTVNAKDVPGLTPAPGFSTIVESDVPVVTDRTMSWDATGYGAHAETSIEAPAQTWYFAEGSTRQLGTQNGTPIGFSLYYLIANPNASPVDVQITYLRPLQQPPIVLTYQVNALARRTIWVNGQDPALTSTDVSAIVSSTDPTLPIIVERAMYLNAQGKQFGAGHDAAGATAPSLDWFLAEGATGPVFDMYLLIANPNGAAADLDVTYLLAGGITLTRPYQVAPNSRRTIWVNGQGADGVSLEWASVSTRVHSTNGVPVVVERAMWWPSPGWAGWYEAHCSGGSTATDTIWAVADGEQGGARNTQTFILVANLSAYAGRARVTLLFEDGTSASTDVDLSANSRSTVWTGSGPSSLFGSQAVGKRFGALVQSLDVNGQAADIVVERAMYWDVGGVWWAAGTNVVATRLR